MQTYTVQVEYLVPFYRHVAVEAASPADACAKAIEKAEEEGGFEDCHDGCSPSYVEGIVEGEHPDIYHGGETHPVPQELSRDSAEMDKWLGEKPDPVRDAASELLAALKALDMCRRGYGTASFWDLFRERALPAIAKAEGKPNG